MRPFSRADRVAGLIREVIADTLRKKIKDPRLDSVIISGVKLSPDLKNARVYFVVSGKDEERIKSAAAGLQKASGFLKRTLGRELTLRYMPKLNFFYDDSFDYGERIEELLKSIKTGYGTDHKASEE